MHARAGELAEAEVVEVIVVEVVLIVLGVRVGEGVEAGVGAGVGVGAGGVCVKISTTKVPPVEGCSATSPKDVEKVESSSCANYM